MPDAKKSWQHVWMPRVRGIIILLVGLCIGFFGSHGYWSRQFLSKEVNDSEQRLGSGSLINPLLDCEVVNKTNIQQYQALKDKVTATIADETSKKTVDHVSVYFRGLNSGHWVGINENENYVGASLIKLPVAFAYEKLAQTKPETLTQQLTDDVNPQTPQINQNIKPEQTVAFGKAYTVQDLLTRMLVYSDNAALTVLAKNIPQQTIDSVFSDIDITPEHDSDGNILISPKSYALFFRVLFNSTYFSRETSEALLQTLTQTDFTDGIVAGVPGTISVAHKFGERTETDQTGAVLDSELHDCGIVYYPKHPYLLCVMTRGQNQTALPSVIQHISSTVYTQMDAYWKKQ